MWDYQKRLSQFVDNYVDLSTFNDRGKRFNQLEKDKQEKLVDTYSGLHYEIEQAKDFNIIKGD